MQRFALAVLLLPALLPAQKDAKSGVSPSAISLPSGPGSIEGLGESFEPQLNSGTFAYALPMRVPPGRAGFAPELALVYDGGHGNGALGPGWRIAGMAVRRQVDKGLPRYGDADTFINERGEELVRVEGAPTDAVQVFRLKNEGAFTRYEYRRAEDRWTCTDRSGRRYFLGAREDSTGAARIARPGGGTYAWHVAEAVDTNSNRILYAYRADGAQLYPERIEYGATERNDPASLQRIEFAWATRPDPFVDYRPTFRLATALRLACVTMTSGGTPVRRYDMAYAAGRDVSLLERVTLVGDDGVSALPPVEFTYTRSTPSISPPLRTLSGAGRVRLARPGETTDDGAAEIVDFNADGLPDFYVTRNSSSGPLEYDLFFENLGDGTFAERRLSAEESLGLPLQSSTTFLRDIDGNGTPDILAEIGAGAENFIMRANTGGRWSATTTPVVLPPGTSAQSVFLSSNVRAVDLDFDKRVDTIRAVETVDIGGVGVAFRAYLNPGNGSIIAEPQTPRLRGLSGSLTFATAGGRLLLADMNGDRLQDLVLLRDAGNGGPIFWPSMGFGRFDDSTSGFRFASPPNFGGNETRLAAAEVADLDGDGLADIFELVGRSLRVWRNADGARFAAPATVDLGGQYDSSSATWRLADVDGDGLDELVFHVFSRPTPDYLPTGLHALRLFGPQPPNLLESATNGIGRTTRVEYRAHTADLLRDRAQGIAWDSPPPFPVTVVAALVETDGFIERDAEGNESLREYRSEFTYSRGYYDGMEKEFRGFESALRRDIGDSTAPTLVNEFDFDTGRTIEALKGVLLGSETRTESGAVFHREAATWRTRTLFPPVAGRDSRAVVFPYRKGLLRDIIEQGTAAPLQTEVQTRFDDYGNETLRAEFGIVEGTDRLAGGDERVTVRTFTAGSESGRARWLLDRPVRVEVRDASALELTDDGFTVTGPQGIVQRKVHYYDDEDFLGANEEFVARGNLTMARDWIDPAVADAFAITLRQRFDPHGNAILMMDALSPAEPDPGAGHFRTVRYDDAFATFPLEETIHIGGGAAPLAISAGWDTGFGLVTSSVDFSGNATRYEFDTFGRPAAVFKPGDPDGWPTLRYQFGLAIPTERGRVVNYIETLRRDLDPAGPAGARDRYHIARQYVDGLGRELMAKEEASEEGDVRVAVTGAQDFSARKTPAFVLQPFFSKRTGTLDERLDFEEITADGWTGTFAEADGSLGVRGLAAAYRTATQYDALLRPAAVTNPDGTTARTEYEPLATRASDELDSDPASPFAGTPVVRRTDGLERLVAVEELVRLADDGEPAADLRAWTTRYRYRVDDLLAEILDANGNRKRMAYDGLQRMTWMNDPNRGILEHTYDAINMVARRDAKGQVTTYAYDGANRLLAEDYLDAANLSPDVRYEYDAPATAIDLGDGTVGTARNTRGQLARVSDLAGTESLSYDARGRIEWSVRAIPDPELGVPAAFQTRFAYDALDRPTEVTYPDGDRAAMAYNARGLLERLVGGATMNATGEDVVGAVDYLPSAQVRALATGDGFVNTRTYDSRLRMNTLRIARSAEELLHYGYAFDAASNITRIDDRRPIAEAPAGSPLRNTQAFRYDDLYRLTQVQYSREAPGAPLRNDGTIDYRYGRIGNMVRQASTIDDRDARGRSVTNLGARTHGGAGGDSNRDGRAPGDPPGPHALTAADNGTDKRALEYDDNGNVTALDGVALTWDFKDRLASAEDATTRAEYRYDHTDRRTVRRVVSKADGSSTTTLYVNRWFEVREHDQPAKHLWNGETRVARATGTLDASATRVQRWRVSEGWNTVSVAIAAPDLAAQLGIGTPRVRAAYVWRPATADYTAANAGTPLPPGTVLRLDMAEAAVLAARGTYARAAQRPIKAPGDYVGAPALEGLPLGDVLPAAVAHAWVPAAGDWRLAQPGDVLAPGAALHARASADTALAAPAASTQITYYHQDHLGSSDTATDGSGTLQERTLHYPYGHPRATQSLIAGTGRLAPQYTFTQKERDAESGLHYFEARYYAAELGVFVGVDPLAQSCASAAVSRSDWAAAYFYCLARPLVRTDRSGNASELVPAIRQSLIERGVMREDERLIHMGGAEFAATTEAMSAMVLNERGAKLSEMKLRDDLPTKLATPNPRDHDVYAALDHFEVLYNQQTHEITPGTYNLASPVELDASGSPVYTARGVWDHFKVDTAAKLLGVYVITPQEFDPLAHEMWLTRTGNSGVLRAEPILKPGWERSGDGRLQYFSPGD